MTCRPDASAELELCTNCGMCCDGTLYSWARSAADEGPAQAAAGLDTFEVRGHSAFVLPCPLLDGACCTIYETRFHICRAFACKQLRRYRTGAVTLAEARGAVAEARRLHANLCALAPEARTRAGRDALRQTNPWQTITEPEARARGARLELEIRVFENFLNRKFRPHRESAKQGAQ